MGWPHSLEDRFLLDRMRQVIAEREITTVVETGLLDGGSAAVFCGLVPYYVGIDIEPAAVERTRAQLTNVAATWRLYEGDSAQVLPVIMPTLPANHTLFFLDAHDFEGDPALHRLWPMPAEIAAIPKGQGILCLHDIFIPEKNLPGGLGRAEFWLPDGQGRQRKVFTYDLIKDALSAWSNTHRVEYMSQSDAVTGHAGAAFIFPT